MYFVALTLWAANAFQYFYAYLESRRQIHGLKPMFQDLEFYCELFNIIPCLGYMGTSMWALIVIFGPLQTAESLTPPIAAYHFYAGQFDNVQALTLVINLVWDVLFTIDAILYIILWYKDGVGGGKGDGYYRPEEGDGTPMLDKTKQDEFE